MALDRIRGDPVLQPPGHQTNVVNKAIVSRIGLNIKRFGKVLTGSAFPVNSECHIATYPPPANTACRCGTGTITDRRFRPADVQA
jgi:hypothetical protein